MKSGCLGAKIKQKREGDGALGNLESSVETENIKTDLSLFTFSSQTNWISGCLTLFYTTATQTLNF